MDTSSRPYMEASRCVLVVVDVQNDFCHADGAVSRLGQDTLAVRVAVSRLLEFLQVARRVGVPRIFLRNEHSEWYDTPAWRARGHGGTSLDVDSVPVVDENTWGSEFFEVCPESDELIITKRRYSGFAYTPLELAIRGAGADTVVLTGTQTNVCVMATATDAIFRGFFPVLVRDCVASGDRVLHDAAVKDFGERLGHVVEATELEKAWLDG